MMAQIQINPNFFRWYVSSCAHMVETNTCPYPVYDAKFRPDNREDRQYIEVYYIGPILRAIGKGKSEARLGVHLVATSMKDDVNAYYPEQVAGWAVKLLKDCFEVKANKLQIGPSMFAEASGDESVIGLANRDSDIEIENLGSLDVIHRLNVYTTYLWEITWASLP